MAGLAATAALAERGFHVTLLESRGRLGGRAGSFTDAASGQVMDVCQHVSMGCCTNFAHFCRIVGVAHLFQTQRRPLLHDAGSPRQPLRRRPPPCALHLARAFLRAHYLGLADKARIAWGMACLRLAPPDADPPFRDWLRRHGQTPRTIDRFWTVVLTSALNESPNRVGLRYARKVFVDAFLRHRRGFEVELPAVPLGRLYGKELLGWLDRRAVRLLLGRAARAIQLRDGRVPCVELRDGETIAADWYVAAVPFDRLLDLLPPNAADLPAFASLVVWRLLRSPASIYGTTGRSPPCRTSSSSIASASGSSTAARSRPENTMSRSSSAPPATSAASAMTRWAGASPTKWRGSSPAAAGGALVRSRVVTEQSATFSAVPGVDHWRPAQASPIANLFLAGDWTATGWPATMEGAVRSGYLAAEALLARCGRPERLVQPDL